MFGLDDLAAATILSGGASALGNIFGSFLGSNSQDKTNKANMKLAQYQFEANKEMWRMNNEYNSPMAQMQRLKAAGLNPNLVYANGADNTSSSAPTYEAPRLQAYTNFGDLGASQITNSLMTAAQIQQMNKQNKNLEIDYAAKRQQMLRESIKMARDMMENRMYRETYEDAKDLMKLSVSQARSNIAQTNSNTARLNQEVQYIQARVQLAKMQNLMTKAQYNRIVRLLPFEVRKLSAETSISEKMAKDYANYGVRPNDPLWARVLAKLLPEAGVAASEDIRKRLEELGENPTWNDIKNQFPE